MNADEIRDLAIEKLTAVDLVAEKFIAEDGYASVAMLSPEQAARRAVDALTEIALLPTGVEERTLEDGYAKVGVGPHGFTFDSKPSTRQHRYVSSWADG